MPSLRRLLATPGFTFTALLTLALGIGLNTSMFSVLNELMLRSLAYPESERLVRVYRTAPQSQSWPHAPANVLDYQAENKVFSHLAALRWTNYSLSAPGQPAERFRAMEVSANFFPTLGVAPLLGRVFTAEEDRPGNDRVVVLTHASWLARFGGDPDIVGRDIRLNSEPVTVIGIMPPGYEDRLIWSRIEAWRPIAFTDEQRATRTTNYIHLVGRLSAGVSINQAQASLDVLALQLATHHSHMTGERLMSLARSSQNDTGQRMTWFIVGLAGFVLLIACANLASLQFARTAARTREFAIRSALGASRLRLMRDLLSETLLLGLGGGALGLLVATWGNDFLSRRLLIGTTPGLALPIDFKLLGFALAVSLLVGLAFGVLPAWLASRPDVNETLKQNTRGGTASRAQHRLRQALIVSEIALALVLLAGAGFFVRGIQRFADREVGWRPDGLLTGYIALSSTKYPDDARRRAFHEQLQEKLAALPGVERVALANTLPTWGFSGSANIVVEGRPAPAPGQASLAYSTPISGSFFETLGIPLVAGRTFGAADRADSPRVIVINETMARTLWPGESALGKRIGSPGDEPEWREIVGVVRDIRVAGHIGTPETSFQMYRSLTQTPVSYVTLALRTHAPPETLAAAVRQIVASIDPDQPIHDIATVRLEIDRSLANLALTGWLLTAFALLGVGLAALGIYGLISGSVIQRTHEIGIRLALGAQLRDILALFVGQGLRLTLAGTLLGLAGAFAIARLLQAIIPEIPPAESLTFATITVLLVATALLASYLPARRAAKVSPLTALRAE
ncbi:MAG: ABC transporter permease [Verrucomicrobiota bacterium]